VTSDEAAFTTIFDAHRDVVLGFLVGRTSDREAARDLLQETFLRAWRRLDEVSAMEPERQRAWLVTVARNLVIDRYRAEATRTATAEAVEQHALAPDLTPEPSEHVEWRDRLARVHGAIADLPEEERTILAMATVGELTSGEIGAALDQPAGTVRYKLHRARERLAAALDAEEVRQ
jgi:RNA polymerase sigma-70 factor, ECF subfamily